MTLPDVEELFEYWGEYPPLTELLANVHGYKPLKTSKTAAQNSGVMDPISFLHWQKITKGKRIGPNG